MRKPLLHVGLAAVCLSLLTACVSSGNHATNTPTSSAPSVSGSAPAPAGSGGASTSSASSVSGSASAPAGSGGTSTSSAPSVSGSAPPAISYRGPNGEVPVSASTISLSAADLAKLKAGNFSVGMIWADPQDPTLLALRAKLKEFGIKITAEVDTNFDLQKEFNAVQTMLTKKPNVVVALISDSKASTKNFQPLVAAKIPLVFEENIPDGFTYGHGYASSVAQDYAAAAGYAADVIAKAMNDKGKLGFLTYDANFFVTNQWDKAFKDDITTKYPNIQLVEAGFPDPTKVQGVAAGLITRNPDLAGIYATWNDPLDGALAALRAAGMTKVPATTVGVGQSTALDIASRNQIPGVGGVASYDEGVLEAEMAAYIVLGKKAPELVVSPAFPVTRDNLASGWKQTYNTPLPADVAAALAKG